MLIGESQRACRGGRDGFTLIELLVVLAIIATLVSIVAPRYFASVDRAREAALKADLRQMREAIDKHYGDTGRYPETLKALVDERYLQSIPPDPVTDRTDTWVPLAYPDQTRPGVFNVRSGASGSAADGTAYASW
jgi:general secretion pathway protein G